MIIIIQLYNFRISLLLLSEQIHLVTIYWKVFRPSSLLFLYKHDYKLFSIFSKKIRKFFRKVQKLRGSKRIALRNREHKRTISNKNCFNQLERLLLI